MFTLSIEHAITDFATWKAAFDRFAEARGKSGVIGDRIRRPIDDPHRLIIELDFPTSEQAEAFRQYLTNTVWSNPEASPALAGTATTRVLEPVSAAG
ncbi:MAG: hypothetical protein JO147_03210 [Actinobacteria bacterium]|nr:hypothetical protein [Actinomycetota bacterium]